MQFSPINCPPALRHNATPLFLAAGALAGATAYFGWPTEPHPYTGPILAALGFLFLLACRCHAKTLSLAPPAWFLISLGLFFAIAQIQVMRAEAFPWPQLLAKPHWARGEVAAIYPNEAKPERATLELRHVTFYGLHPGTLEVPILRLGVYRSQISGTQVGDTVSAPVKPFPPDAPTKPGQRDYRLLRYLGDSTLFGFAQGRIETQTGLPPTPQPKPSAWLERARARVKAATQPYADGVLTALLLAEQRQVPKPLQEAYRVAGLSHLLAVSGLQLTLVGGGVFWLVRWLLAWIPALALRYNTKALGAIAGLAAAAGYAWLAGAPVSVQRALLMVAILLLAVLLGRMRGLLRAWVAALLIVLAYNPAAITMAGFQLSFAAVLGLIGLGHAYGHPQTWFQKAQWLARSSVVAAWATAPLILMQFGQLNVLGILANLLAVPLMGLVTWLSFAALVVMPLHLEQPFLTLASYGAEATNQLATAFAKLPLATVTLPNQLWPVAALMAVGFLAAINLRKPHATIIAALALLAFGAGAATRAPANPVVIEEGGKTLTQNHLSPEALAKGETELPATACDSTGCRTATSHGTILKLTMPATPEDCANATLLLAPPKGACPTRTLTPGTFAWATLAHGRATVQPLYCTRPWQRFTQGCTHLRPTLATGEQE
jgi:competence protein ComEC